MKNAIAWILEKSERIADAIVGLFGLLLTVAVIGCVLGFGVWVTIRIYEFLERRF